MNRPRSLPALQRLMQFRFMGREQVRKEHGAFHEPQKVAQASCLFGADRLEACPTLQPAARFMAATHVRFFEVFPLHELGWRETPSSPDLRTTEIRARRSLAPPFMLI